MLEIDNVDVSRARLLMRVIKSELLAVSVGYVTCIYEAVCLPKNVINNFVGFGDIKICR
jgi:hypothetical protein